MNRYQSQYKASFSDIALYKTPKAQKVQRPRKLLITDELVREIRIKHQHEGLSKREIYESYGRSLNLTMRYIEQILDYEIRSKVIVI
jgi:hypothetical protein